MISIPKYGEIVKDGTESQAGYDFLSDMASTINDIPEAVDTQSLQDQIDALSSTLADQPKVQVYTEDEPTIIEEDYDFYDISVTLKLDAGIANKAYYISSPSPPISMPSLLSAGFTLGNNDSVEREITHTAKATLDQLNFGGGKVGVYTTSTGYSVVKWTVIKYKTGA